MALRAQTPSLRARQASPTDVRTASERLKCRSAIAWILPSPARARRACPLPGQGEGSRKACALILNARRRLLCSFLILNRALRALCARRRLLSSLRLLLRQGAIRLVSGALVDVKGHGRAGGA